MRYFVVGCVLGLGLRLFIGFLVVSLVCIACCFVILSVLFGLAFMFVFGECLLVVLRLIILGLVVFGVCLAVFSWVS